METAYNWTPDGKKTKKADFPESPEGQLAFLRALNAAVHGLPNGLGQGVFWWEPAAEGTLRSRSFFDKMATRSRSSRPSIHSDSTGSEWPLYI